MKKFIAFEMKTLTFALSFSFQRWKEQYFVNVGTDCGLTIAGFYYVCFSCSDGSISGFYYDPNSRWLPLLIRNDSVQFNIELRYVRLVYMSKTHESFAAHFRSLS